MKPTRVVWQTSTELGPGSLELGRIEDGYRLHVVLPRGAVAGVEREVDVSLDFTAAQWAELVVSAAELMDVAELVS